MIKVGISQCLLGDTIRFDGGHKRDRYCTENLSQVFRFEPLCPEIGIGLPVPRPAIRLVERGTAVIARFSKDENSDLTSELNDFADNHYQKLSDLSGYIVCKASPSCGLERVKVYNAKGGSQAKGVGIFTQRLKALFPNLPIEEDGRLNDPLLRDSFVKRVYIYNEWKRMALEKQGNTRTQHQKLTQFHSRHKYTVLAHSQTIYRQLGRIVANVKKTGIKETSETYIALLMHALTTVASRNNNANVLMHIQGFLKKHLTVWDKAELTESILDYQKELQPILVPIALLKHHLKTLDCPFIQQQSFLNPYPKQLGIRVKTL